METGALHHSQKKRPIVIELEAQIDIEKTNLKTREQQATTVRGQQKLATQKGIIEGLETALKIAKRQK